MDIKRNDRFEFAFFSKSTERRLLARVKRVERVQSGRQYKIPK